MTTKGKMNTKKNLPKDNSQHIKSKALKLFLDDMNNPLIIITYKYDSRVENRKLIREKIWQWVTEDGSKRNISYLPCVFIRKDVIDRLDLTTLNVANQIYLHTNSDLLGTINNEIDLIRLIKMIQRGKKYKRFQELEYNSEESSVRLKSPHKDFVIYDTKVFNDVANEIQLEITRKYQNKIKGELE